MITKKNFSRLGTYFICNGFGKTFWHLVAVIQGRISNRFQRIGRKLFGGLRIWLFERDCMGDFKCPVCAKTVSYFEPVSSYLLSNWYRYKYSRSIFNLETFNLRRFKCPKCAATDRERFIALYFDSLRDVVEDTFSILDIGPKLRMIRYFHRQFGKKYYSVDKFSKYVDENLDIVDLSTIDTSSVSHVICSHVLEHIPSEVEAVDELVRIVKPGGQIICLVPLDPTLNETIEESADLSVSDRWRLYLDGTHQRMYSRQGLENLFLSRGMNIEYFVTADLDEQLVEACGIALDARLYIFRKPINYTPPRKSSLKGDTDISLTKTKQKVI